MISGKLARVIPMARIALRTSFLLVFCAGVFFIGIPLFKKCRQLYYVHVADIPRWMKTSVALTPTSAQLTLGHALVFEDEDGLTGYVYFTDIRNGQADYTLVLFQNDKRIARTGRLSCWTILPWKNTPSIQDEWIFIGDGPMPHFAWTPYNALLFSHPKIQRVCVLPLEKVLDDSFNVGDVKWEQAESITY